MRRQCPTCGELIDARETPIHLCGPPMHTVHPKEAEVALAALLQKAKADMRERCAKLADDYEPERGDNPIGTSGNIAAAIRKIPLEDS